MISVLIADDHAVVRTGFRLLLEDCDDISVVAEAESGEEAIELYDSTTPDIILMDLAMPGMGGIEAIKKILSKDKNARILVLSMHEDISHPKRVIQAGAAGYLTKHQAPETLIDAIKKIAKGETIIDPDLAQRMVVADASGATSPIDTLSKREFEIFEKLALGSSVKEIASNLNLSSSTVGTHLYNIKQKLGVVNQAEISLIALRNGIIDPSS